MKKYFVFSALLMTILSILIGNLIIKSAEYNSPLGANASFALYPSEANITKAQIIEDLTRIASENDAVLLKASTNSQTYRSERDLIYFSAEAPSGNIPAIDADRKINWLNNGLTGRLMPASEIKGETIAGDYNITHSVKGEEALKQWAQAHEIALQYRQPKSFLTQIYSMFTQDGLLLSYIAVLLLNLALVIADVLNRTYLRSLQLLNGLTVKAINRQQYMRVMNWSVFGAAIGGFSSCIYAFSAWGEQTAVAVIYAALPYFIGGIVFEILAVILVGYIFAPNVELIRTRSLPVQHYRRMNLGIQVLAVVVCVIACVPAASLGKNMLLAYQQQERAKIMRQSVSVTINGDASIDTPEGQRDLQNLLAKSELQDTAVLSYSIQSGVQLSTEEMGEYDSLDIVSENFFDFFKITQESLIPTEWEEISPQVREFLDVQLRFFIPESEKTPRDTYKFYRLIDNTNYISVGTNVGYGGTIEKPDNPLIMVPVMPVSQMDIEGFVIPMISTGNLFFTDPELAKDAWYSSSLASSVFSIEQIADVNLISAQYFRTKVISYIAAIIVSFLLIVATAWQGALIWARGNYKYIFIALTAGIEMKKIYAAPVKKTFALTCAAGLLALVATLILFSAYSDPITGIVTVLLLLLLFRLVSVLAYVFNIRHTFENLILRRA